MNVTIENRLDKQEIEKKLDQFQRDLALWNFRHQKLGEAFQIHQNGLAAMQKRILELLAENSRLSDEPGEVN